MKKILPGNRIYRVYHIYNNGYKTVFIVDANNAHALGIAKKIQRRIGETTGRLAVRWNIYDGNHGITKLPLGTVIYPKDRS